MKASKKEYLILGVILFLGLLIRLYHFNTFSLSNDELSAIYRLNFNNLHDLIIGGVPKICCKVATSRNWYLSPTDKP